MLNENDYPMSYKEFEKRIIELFLEDFENHFEWRFYQSDDVSGYLCERICEEIQEKFDEIMKFKGDAKPVRKLENECRDYYNDCEYEEAIKVCDKILKSNPQNHHALTYKVLSYYYLKDYENALNVVKKALETIMIIQNS